MAIARALMQKAKIILADEPIASLDPESARIVMETLHDINQNDGITVVVTLHQVVVNVMQGFHHDAGGFRIQRGDGLVGKDDFRFLHQGTGDGHALLLSTGEGGDALMGEVRHAYAGECPQRLLLL